MARKGYYKGGPGTEIGSKEELPTYDLPDLVVTDKRFDPNDVPPVDFDLTDINYILESGDTGTQHGRFMQHMFHKLNIIDGLGILRSNKPTQ